MAAVDVPVALLGYGTVGEAVHRLLSESGDEIERATGHRIRVVRALVRDARRERGFPAGDGVLTTEFAEIRDDPSIALIRVHPVKGEYWDSPSSTIGYALSFVSSLITGKKPDLGENQKVSLQ